MAALLTAPLASAITYFQAVVLGVLQGVTELFPISSLGHTVLFPTLFGWNELVHASNRSKHSFWLAFVVMLHVGSAIGLLIYYRRDWVEIIGAFFRTLQTRRVQTPNERLAWLIILASIPAGIIALALEHQLRDADGEAGGRGDLPDGQRLPAVRRRARFAAARPFENWRSPRAPSPTERDGSTRSSTARRSSSASRSRRRWSPASAATA